MIFCVKKTHILLVSYQLINTPHTSYRRIAKYLKIMENRIIYHIIVTFHTTKS